MKTILIPTDFSANAWNAMEYAAAMFKGETCKYILINTYHTAPTTVDAISLSYIEPMAKASVDGLKSQQERFEALEHHPNTFVETISVYGNIVPNLNKVIDDQHVDFVVMGTKGTSGISEVLLGSNTARVIANSQCPVFCIPEEAVYQPFRKIVLATDYQQIQDEGLLAPLQELAEKHSAEIFLLNVRSKQEVPVSLEEAEEGFALHEYFNGVPHHFRTSNAERIEEGIQEFSQTNQIELITLIKRNHSFWEQLFNTSTCLVLK